MFSTLKFYLRSKLLCTTRNSSLNLHINHNCVGKTWVKIFPSFFHTKMSLFAHDNIFIHFSYTIIFVVCICACKKKRMLIEMCEGERRKKGKTGRNLCLLNLTAINILSVTMVLYIISLLFLFMCLINHFVFFLSIVMCGKRAFVDSFHDLLDRWWRIWCGIIRLVL